MRHHIQALLAIIQKIIADPAYHDYLAILKGARNGLVYGVKVRFPHALVMALLFSKADWRTKARQVLTATATHAMNLAKFVSLYKTVMLLQKKRRKGKEESLDSFIAGLVGGYVVFGDRTAINEQIVLYVCSRVVASFIPREVTDMPQSPGGKVVPLRPNPQHFKLFAALCWGAVMWLFQEKEETLQAGMHKSMVYLYRDSERWNSLRTLFWHNK